MEVHAQHTPGPGRPLLVAVVDGPEQVDRALDEGADLIDPSAADPAARAAIRAGWPAAVWTGSPADLVDADRPPGPAGNPAPAGDAAPATGSGDAAAVAVAAVSTWLGAPAIRTRHVRAVRRAIDMAASVRGTRPPARTIRGLA